MTDASHRHIVAPRSRVSQEMREERQPHRGMVFWFTGLSGSGKSTLAHAVEEALFNKGYNIIVLDGDAVRKGLCGDLGFSSEERRENNRRVAEIARLFARNGTICLCALISPSEAFRVQAKSIVGEEFFREIFISCPVEECERRDVKGFYKKAKSGEIAGYTGVSSAYEPPACPDCSIRTDGRSVAESAAELQDFIARESARGR